MFALSTPIHALLSAFLSTAIAEHPGIFILTAALGAFPDVAGWIDGKVRGPVYRWTLGVYGLIHRPWLHIKNKTHLVLFIFFVWVVLLPIGLHCLIDLLTHKTGGGWNKTGWTLEILSYVFIAINIINIYELIIRLWG